MSQKRRGEIIGGILGIIFALFLGICTIYETGFSNEPDAYCRVSVTLANPPETVKASKNPANWVFYFKEYPGINFGVQKNCFSDEGAASLNTGDTASITLLKEDYRRIILNEGNFFERLVSRRPHLYGYTTNGKEYIDFNKISAKHMNQTLGYAVMLGVVILLLFSCLKVLFFKKQSE